MATQAVLSILLFLRLHGAASICVDGIAKPNFTKGEIVEVIYAQAPLFSTDPKIGQKGSLINLFHSSVVLAQGAGASRQYWTLEFGFMVTSPLASMAPQIVPNASAPGGVSMVWHNTAKYCLTHGLLHGRSHWTTHLDTVTSVTVDDALKAFDEFVIPLNNSKSDARPQYNTFKVAHAGFFGKIKRTFIDDLTCNHGAVWFVHYLQRLGNPVPPHFQFKGTVAVVNAWGVKRIRPEDRQWHHVIDFYKKLSEVAYSNKSAVHKVIDLMEIPFERRFAYDPNTQEYYELLGNFFPWVFFQYDTFPLRGPPWMEASDEKAAAAPVLV